MDIRLLLFTPNVEASLGLRPFSGKSLLVIVGLQKVTYASSLAAAVLKICSPVHARKLQRQLPVLFLT